MKKEVVSKLRQKVKVDIVISDNIKIYYTGKFKGFTARCTINIVHPLDTSPDRSVGSMQDLRTEGRWFGFLICFRGLVIAIASGCIIFVR